MSLTFDDGEDQRVQLIVHSLKPPFLDGRVSFSMQQVSQGVGCNPSLSHAAVLPRFYHPYLWIRKIVPMRLGEGGGGCCVLNNVLVGLSTVFRLTAYEA